jgi:N-acetylmuramoyl-L-alanine amidase
MVDKPSMQVYNSPHYYTNRKGRQPRGIILHIMGGATGSIEAATNWFMNPNSGTSANYGIAKNGAIRQYVDPRHGPWSNGLTWTGSGWVNARGVPVKPTWRLLQVPHNPNLDLISIEHEGQPWQDWTPAMIRSSGWLIAWLIQQYPRIRPDRDHIIGHYQLDTIDRPFCPGGKCPWDLILKTVHEYLGTGAPSGQQVQDVIGVKRMYIAAMDYATQVLTANSSDPEGAQRMAEINLGFNTAIAVAAPDPGNLQDALAQTKELERVMNVARDMLNFATSDPDTTDRFMRVRRLLGLSQRGHWVIRPNGTVILDRIVMLETPEVDELPGNQV